VKLSVGVTSDEAELKFERALEESEEFTEFKERVFTRQSERQPKRRSKGSSN